MKNLVGTSTKLNKFLYKTPMTWENGDIAPSLCQESARSLIEHLLTCSPSVSELIEMRLDKRFEQFYYDFHKELEDGTGVIFLPMFLSPSDYTLDVIYKTFMNFCLFLGEPVPINKQGDVLREVKDTGRKDSITAPARGHLTNQELAFHSDRADITTLLCISQAAQGGEFKIGSSATLLRELKKRMDLLDILTSDIPHDLRDEGRDNMSICAHPIISYENIFLVRYIRKFIESTVRFGLTINSKLSEALDYIDNIVNSDTFSHKLILRPGDLIIFNNHLTLHSRNSFIDSGLYQRCLLRIWLSSEFTRPLPESFKPIFHNVAPGVSRGGVR